jgi:hypothetical protein
MEIKANRETCQAKHYCVAGDYGKCDVSICNCVSGFGDQ